MARRFATDGAAGGTLGQVPDGVAQGPGYAPWASLRIDETGKTLEKSLKACRLPLAIDTPRVETILTENPTAQGLF
jgi:CO/xanthine dehydrogenase Mo-binding subunit